MSYAKNRGREEKDVFNEGFLLYSCTQCYNGTRRLILHGSNLNSKIGRRLEDTDVPNLSNFLMKYEDIVSLSLPYNRLTSTGFKRLIDYFLVRHNVYELDVQYNDITSTGTKYMSEVGSDLQIISLRLNGNKIGIEGSKYVALYLLKNPYIKYLDVADVDQTASSLVYFTTVLRMDQEYSNDTLKILNISRPNTGWKDSFDPTDLASVVGAMLRHNTSLAALHLQKYSFSCHDVESMLLDGKYNNTLTLLDLANNNIGDSGVEHIVKWLVGRPALRGLLLSRNIVTDYGARALSFNIPFSRLVLLDVSYNRISNEGITDILNSLKKSPWMRQLYIFGNQIGETAAQIINRMLISKVLIQENLDVRPFRVDQEWYVAYYPASRYEQYNYTVWHAPYVYSPKIYRIETIFKDKHILMEHFQSLYFKVFEQVKLKTGSITHTCKDHTTNKIEPLRQSICTICNQSEKKLDTFHSDSIITSDSSCINQQEEKNGSRFQGENHLNECNCRECIEKKSNIKLLATSTRSQIQDCPQPDIRNKIDVVLNNVDFTTKQKILRWINLNETTLDEDLAYADIIGNDGTIQDSEIESSSDEWKWISGIISELLLLAQADTSSHLFCANADDATNLLDAEEERMDNITKLTKECTCENYQSF